IIMMFGRWSFAATVLELPSNANETRTTKAILEGCLTFMAAAQVRIAAAKLQRFYGANRDCKPPLIPAFSLGFKPDDFVANY
ncbi:MAG TPA: hypothetical protein VFC44_24415, partial [Candidatus Saccharimonadales bacterium]|nr:hypothetical protein [Candidatus Saccharimonadales bacterium]